MFCGQNDGFDIVYLSLYSTFLVRPSESENYMVPKYTYKYQVLTSSNHSIPLRFSFFDSTITK